MNKKLLKITEINEDEIRLYVLPNEYFTPVNYIQNLINQLQSDVFPLFSVSGSAPFTILRNIFCFVDHTSRLKYGKGTKQTKRMVGLLSEFATFDTYINSKYKRYCEYLVQIYRHDLVHNIRPLPKFIKVIEKGNNKPSNKITWFIISSSLRDDAMKDFESLRNYFKSTRNRKNLGHLRYFDDQIFINNYCLFFDLINFLDGYKNSLSSDKKLQKKLTRNYESIVNDNIKKISNFVLDKNKDKEVRIYKK